LIIHFTKPYALYLLFLIALSISPYPSTLTP
jgi:hypothetical protein